MTITDESYVSVLRWKGAEKRAVKALSPDIKRTVVPVIEFVPKDFWETAEQAAVNTVGKEIAENWGWRNPVIIDPHLLGDDLAARNIEFVLSALKRYNVPCAIVTDVSRTEEYQQAVERSLSRINSLELCFRISVIHLRATGLDSPVRELLARFSSAARDVHMILDFGLISDEGANFAPTWNSLPMARDWKSLTTLAGSFPKDLSHLAPNGEHWLPRGEWESWCSLNERSSLPTAFGDYTIQHPFFEEREGKGYNFSPSIRYTCPDGWLIFRGEGVKNDDGVGYEQWLGEAALLSEKNEFCGGSFSWGDTFIHDKSKEPLNPGSIKDWLAATVNHHMTLVTRQIRAVKAPAKLRG
jgi:Beta protein